MEDQFTRWSLTPTEKEVALLMLKGVGHKEAASVLGRSERTARQHAVSVYRKAGLAGRAELSAFFLEDPILPYMQPYDDTQAAADAGLHPRDVRLR